MGHNDHLDNWDTEVYKKTCSCGAVYEITESDGIPGCRSIEKVYCKFCGKELARHFGDCDGVSYMWIQPFRISSGLNVPVLRIISVHVAPFHVFSILSGFFVKKQRKAAARSEQTPIPSELPGRAAIAISPSAPNPVD